MLDSVNTSVPGLETSLFKFILYAFTVVDPPLDEAALKVTISPDSAAVDVYWAGGFFDTIGPGGTYACVPALTPETSDILLSDSELLCATT